MTSSHHISAPAIACGVLPTSVKEIPAIKTDIQLMSSGGDLIFCSRFTLCKRSTVFAELLSDTNETAFSVPLTTAILREIRHVCYFGTCSFHAEPANETMMRMLCKLLVAMELYKVDNILLMKIYIKIIRDMSATLSLALVVMDELGLEYTEEMNYWTAQTVNDAVFVFLFNPCKALFPEKSGFGGVCSIQDAKMQQLLSKLKACKVGTVWLEFEALYVWANADPSDRVAAAELWEETDMLARLKADDPAAFFSTTSQTNCFKADGFATSKAFTALYNHAHTKNRDVAKHSLERQDDGSKRPVCGLFIVIYMSLSIMLFTALGFIDLGAACMLQVFLGCLLGYFAFQFWG